MIMSLKQTYRNSIVNHVVFISRPIPFRLAALASASICRPTPTTEAEQTQNFGLVKAAGRAFSEEEVVRDHDERSIYVRTPREQARIGRVNSMTLRCAEVVHRHGAREDAAGDRYRDSDGASRR